MKKKIYLSFLLLLFCQLAQAQEGVHTSIHHHYQTPRALGMGGAFVAVADDYSAVLYNPAGLSRLEESQTNLSMEGQISGGQIYSFFNDLSQAGTSASSAADRTTALFNVLQNNYGKQYSIRGGLLEGVTSNPGWGLAVIPVDFTMDVKVHQLGSPALNIRAFLDTTIAVGIGRKFKHISIPGKMSWGLTGKLINRGYASKQLQALDLSVDSNIFQSSDLRYGYTFDADWGFLYTPIVPTTGFFSVFRTARPTLGIVVRNIIDSGFGNTLPGMAKSTGTPPEKLNRVLDVGSRFEMPSVFIFGSRFVMDVTDIGHPNFNLRKGSHLGLEFDWRMTSWWKGQYRVGFNQGYWTAGVSALLATFRLDITSYSEDIGSYSEPKENRLILAKFNIDI